MPLPLINLQRGSDTKTLISLILVGKRKYIQRKFDSCSW